MSEGSVAVPEDSLVDRKSILKGLGVMEILQANSQIDKEFGAVNIDDAKATHALCYNWLPKSQNTDSPALVYFSSKAGSTEAMHKIDEEADSWADFETAFSDVAQKSSSMLVCGDESMVMSLFTGATSSTFDDGGQSPSNRVRDLSAYLSNTHQTGMSSSSSSADEEDECEQHGTDSERDSSDEVGDTSEYQYYIAMSDDEADNFTHDSDGADPGVTEKIVEADYTFGDYESAIVNATAPAITQRVNDRSEKKPIHDVSKPKAPVVPSLQPLTTEKISRIKSAMEGFVLNPRGGPSRSAEMIAERILQAKPRLGDEVDIPNSTNHV